MYFCHSTRMCSFTFHGNIEFYISWVCLLLFREDLEENAVDVPLSIVMVQDYSDCLELFSTGKGDSIDKVYFGYKTGNSFTESSFHQICLSGINICTGHTRNVLIVRVFA